jgi:hypothetical protein
MFSSQLLIFIDFLRFPLVDQTDVEDDACGVADAFAKSQDHSNNPNALLEDDDGDDENGQPGTVKISVHQLCEMLVIREITLPPSM